MGGGHRVGWPPSRRPFKRHGAEMTHGASAEGGWVWRAHRVSGRWPPSRCPLKQRGAPTAPHGASAEQGWVRLRVSVLRSDGRPPAQAARADKPHGASAEGGWPDDAEPHGFRRFHGCGWLS